MQEQPQSIIGDPPTGVSPINVDVSKENLKELRLKELRGHIEQDLQVLVKQASIVRKHMTESKTSTKYKYYSKKFDKISTSVRQMVTAMQQLTHNKEKERENVDIGPTSTTQ